MSKGWWAPCDECDVKVIVDGDGNQVPDVPEWDRFPNCPVCDSTLHFDEMEETLWEREGRLMARARDNLLLSLVAAVEKIHAPVEAVNFVGNRQIPTTVCAGCGTDDGNWRQWPCPTVRALDVVVPQQRDGGAS